MVKNIPENAVTRAPSDEDQRRADMRRFSGRVPRGMEAFAAGLGASFGSSRRTNTKDAMEADGTPLCGSKRTVKKTNGVDFGDAIGKELQSLYDDLVAQPVPDRFLNLLNQLEKNMLSSGVSGSASGESE